jgi:hypothetical protein
MGGYEEVKVPGKAGQVDLRRTASKEANPHM